MNEYKYSHVVINSDDDEDTTYETQPFHARINDPHKSEDLFHPKRKSSMRLYLAAIIATLGPLSFGYTISYSADALPSLRHDPDYQGLSDDKWSWFGSIVMLTALCGGLSGGWLIDYFGRKNTLIFSCLPMIGGWLCIIASSGYFSILMVGRGLTGYSVGVISLVVPVYLAEISNPERRGLLGIFNQIAVVIGILFSYVLGYYLGWNWLSVAGIVPPCSLAVLMIFMPETPQFSLTRFRRQTAIASLSWLRNNSFKEAEYEIREMENVIRASGEKASMSDYFHDPSLYKPLCISLVMMFMQQFSGINAVISYSTDIFESAGLSDPARWTIILGVIQVIATVISALLMDRTGRKKLLIISGLGTAVSEYAFGVYFVLQGTSDTTGLTNITMTTAPMENSSEGSGQYNWLSLSSMFLLITFFSLGLSGIPWLMMSEIFPPRARGLSSGVATFFNWLCSFIVTNQYQNLTQSRIGYEGTYWVFASILVLGAIFVAIFVPETKGRKLEEIEKYFQKPDLIRNPTPWEGSSNFHQLPE